MWYNEVMPKHLVLVLSLLAAVILLTMLNFVTPAGVGPLGVLLLFVLFYILMFGVSFFVVKVFMKATGKQVVRKSYIYAAVIAFGPIMLLASRSLGTVSLLTVGAIIMAVFLACFLVNKRA